jgi:hypothetical protein
MSSLSPKDRVSLCSFTFADGRRCRTPRAAKNPPAAPPPIHSATWPQQGRPLARLHPQHPPRQQTPLESTLTNQTRNC